MILNSGLKEKKSNRHVYAINSSQENFSLEVDADLPRSVFVFVFFLINTFFSLLRQKEKNLIFFSNCSTSNQSKK